MKKSANKVYRMLREAGDEGVTTDEFLRAGVGRLGARIADLRGARLHIVSERLASNKARYFLRPPAESGAALKAESAGLGGNAHPGVQSARNARTPLPSGSLTPPAGSTLPRVRRGDPLFSYDYPPSDVGEWQFHTELTPDGAKSYWLRVDLGAPQERAAA